VYYMLNKPRSCMSLATDGPFKKSAEGGTVMDYVPAAPRVFPVGRLDYDSEGLILLTNDGSFAAVVTSPELGVTKTYLALVESTRPDMHSGVPSHSLLQRGVSEGVRSSCGPQGRHKSELYTLMEANVVSQSADAKRSWVRVVLSEGKNREVRKLFAALGYKVLRLMRSELGPYRPALSLDTSNFDPLAGTFSVSRQGSLDEECMKGSSVCEREAGMLSEEDPLLPGQHLTFSLQEANQVYRHIKCSTAK